jgi:hypothetical protein
VSDYYIVSLKHTHRNDRYVTLWKPNDRGYCFRTTNAGRYAEETVRASLRYYNSGSSIAVPCDVIDSRQVMTTADDQFDGPDGPAFLNTAANWKLLLANVIEAPLYQPEPQYKGAPRYKEAA